MSFILHYSFNWDGGGQERDTAAAAIKSVFPDCTLDIQGANTNPIEVRITNADGTLIWKASQKKLFKKYKKDRNAAIAAIKAAMSKLK